ncbi:hypothetical protein AMELA_G00035100 [Ameiurus melas]|uniref:Uncharacterized protein n=1 Tax=Ameiurus melas TaxID=219545 RepID=A0A7J6BB43_AMEME|nr:hypothetical protein AMELA_G00035100 [Ameiurus melas]
MATVTLQFGWWFACEPASFGKWGYEKKVFQLFVLLPLRSSFQPCPCPDHPPPPL